MSVRVIRIRRAGGDTHPNQDNARREDVASELESGRDDGGGVRQPSDDNVAGREDTADAYTSERHAARSAVRLIKSGHHHIVS